MALDNYGVARQEIATSFAMFEQFSQLVQDSVVKEQKHSIYSFVEAVNEYLPKLSRSMFALVYFTPLAHEDQRHLQNITSGEEVFICIALLTSAGCLINTLMVVLSVYV